MQRVHVIRLLSSLIQARATHCTENKLDVVNLLLHRLRLLAITALVATSNGRSKWNTLSPDEEKEINILCVLNFAKTLIK